MSKILPTVVCVLALGLGACGGSGSSAIASLVDTVAEQRAAVVKAIRVATDAVAALGGESTDAEITAAADAIAAARTAVTDADTLVRRRDGRVRQADFVARQEPRGQEVAHRPGSRRPANAGGCLRRRGVLGAWSPRDRRHPRRPCGMARRRRCRGRSRAPRRRSVSDLETAGTAGSAGRMARRHLHRGRRGCRDRGHRRALHQRRGPGHAAVLRHRRQVRHGQRTRLRRQPADRGWHGRDADRLVLLPHRAGNPDARGGDGRHGADSGQLRRRLGRLRVHAGAGRRLHVLGEARRRIHAGRRQSGNSCRRREPWSRRPTRNTSISGGG